MSAFRDESLVFDFRTNSGAYNNAYQDTWYYMSYACMNYQYLVTGIRIVYVTGNIMLPIFFNTYSFQGFPHQGRYLLVWV